MTNQIEVGKYAMNLKPGDRVIGYGLLIDCIKLSQGIIALFDRHDGIRCAFFSSGGTKLRIVI